MKKQKLGRPPRDYETRVLYKRGIPIEIYDLCLSLVDAELLKYKLKKGL